MYYIGTVPMNGCNPTLYSFHLEVLANFSFVIYWKMLYDDTDRHKCKKYTLPNKYMLLITQMHNDKSNNLSLYN